jgi:hypothetical protein
MGANSNNREVLQYTVLATLIAFVSLAWTIQTLKSLFYGEAY